MYKDLSSLSSDVLQNIAEFLSAESLTALNQCDRRLRLITNREIDRRYRLPIRARTDVDLYDLLAMSTSLFSLKPGNIRRKGVLGFNERFQILSFVASVCDQGIRMDFYIYDKNKGKEFLFKPYYIKREPGREISIDKIKLVDNRVVCIGRKYLAGYSAPQCFLVIWNFFLPNENKAEEIILRETNFFSELAPYCFDCNKQFIVTLHKERFIQIINYKGKLLMCRTVSFSKNDNVVCMAISPGGNRLVFGTQEGFICIYDIASGSKSMQFRAHAYQVSAIAIRNKCIISVGSDWKMKFWCPNTGRLLKDIWIEPRKGCDIDRYVLSVNEIMITPSSQIITRAGSDFSFWDDPS
jgi:WD40 repeat protein